MKCAGCRRRDDFSLLREKTFVFFVVQRNEQEAGKSKLLNNPKLIFKELCNFL